MLSAKGCWTAESLAAWLLLLLASSLVCGCGGGGGGGDQPLWLGMDAAIADVDGNGRNDVIAVGMVFSASYRRGQVLVYRQTAQGVFAAPEVYTVGRYLWRVAAVDVDGDARTDLVVLDVDAGPSAGNRAVWLMRQDPANSGRFLSPQQIIAGTPSNAYAIAVSDSNADGAADVAMSAYDPYRLIVRYQDPTQRGSFLPAANVSLGGSAAQVVAGDVDGDGRGDMLMSVYSQSTGSALALSIQQGDGTLGPVVVPGGQSNLGAVQRLGIADFNGDGLRDLFAFSTRDRTRSGGLTVIRQASGATFMPPVTSAITDFEFADDAVVSELSGDARLDVAVAGTYCTQMVNCGDIRVRVGIYAPTDTGVLSRTVLYDYPFTDFLGGITAGDLDGDGRNDLLMLGDPNRCVVMIQSHSVAGTFEAPRPLR